MIGFVWVAKSGDVGLKLRLGGFESRTDHDTVVAAYGRHFRLIWIIKAANGGVAER